MKRNENSITKAFERLAKAKEERMIRVMKTLCAEAMEYALSIHDPEHQNHIEMGDDYGWIIFKDRVPIASGVKEDGQSDGFDFQYYMETSIPQIVKKGFVGVVVAGMDVVGWFSYDYEMGIINNTIDWVKDNFRTLSK